MIAFALLLAEPQHQHDMMPGMTMPGMTMAPATKPKAKPAKPARKTAQRRRALRNTEAATKPRAAACSVEHAAMGHCTPTEASATMDHGAMPGMGTMSTTADSCPSEHAAMGHCKPPALAPEAPGAEALMDHSAMPGMAMDDGAMVGMAPGPIGNARRPGPERPRRRPFLRSSRHGRRRPPDADGAWRHALLADPVQSGRGSGPRRARRLSLGRGGLVRRRHSPAGREERG